MRRKLANAFLGVVFIVIGICYIVNIAFDLNFTIFFDGWWTLFIIVPCIYNMIDNRINAGNIIGTLIGVVLFLEVQDIWDFSFSLWKLTIPIILIIIGLSIILGGTFRNRNCKTNTFTSTGTEQTYFHANSETIPSYSAVFGGNEPNYEGQKFSGAKATSIFGGTGLKLRNAIIDHDCFIDVTNIFGGTDIYLPSNVKAIIRCNPILGGCDNKFVSSTDPNAPVVTINATCILGGIEIK